MKRLVAFLSLIFSIIVLACCVLSIIFPWYMVTRSSNIDSNNKLRTLYYWDELILTDDNLNSTNIIYPGSSEENVTTYSDLEWDNVKNVFLVTLAFLVIATLSALLGAITILITLFAKSRKGAIAGGVFHVLTMVLLLVAFFQFFRITSAMNKDDSMCNNDATFISNYFEDTDESYCKKFTGETKGLLYKTDFIPYVGWFVNLGGIFFSFVTFIPLFITSKKHF